MFVNRVLAILFWMQMFYPCDSIPRDVLTPYVRKHGSRLSHRAIRECQAIGNEPHELYQVHTSKNVTSPYVEVKRFLKILSPGVNENIVRGHYAIISNPLKTISILEPEHPNGCSYHLRQTVQETAKQRKCDVAINAGYFNTKNGKCLGNVISDGRLAHSSGGVQNAHFGLMKNNSIYIGYVSESDVLHENFFQLVGGVVWVIRNGSSYTNVSKDLECEDTEETGPMNKFVSTRSSRTIIGHNNEGKIIIIQIDGKTNHYGISLWDMQHLLEEMGLVNAINLDGGGSSTFVVNGTVVNYPSDECLNKDFICERKVSTVICVHSPDCNPPNCHGNGHCDMGHCICNKFWLPPHCDQLSCEKNCSSQGLCTANGCICKTGFYGEICNNTCPDNWFGSNCREHCSCVNGGTCHHENGTCFCRPGFYGNKCQNVCPLGFYGHNCSSVCKCKGACYCEPINGSCIAETKSNIYILAKCLADDTIQKEHLVKDFDVKRDFIIFVIVLSIIISAAVGSGAFYIFYFCCRYCKNRNKYRHQARYISLQALTKVSESSESEDVIEPPN